MVNNVTLVGRVAREVELRTLQTGTSVATLILAVDRDQLTKDGKREADFIKVQVWNKTAEYAKNNIEKGRLISVNGSIRTNSYETKEGQKRTDVFVNGSRITTLEKPRNAQPKKEVETKDTYLTEDDMPF